MQKIGTVPNSNADNNGEWTEGNPQSGAPATTLKAPWLNTIQRELANIVTGTGGELNPENDGQLLQVLQSKFGGTGQVKTVVFTAGGTYVPPGGVKALDLIAVGAGGGAGGVEGQGSGTAGAGGGGAGGAVSLLTKTTIDPSYSIVIGAKGTRGAAGNNNGSAGGNTTITSDSVNIIAGGGGGGGGVLAGSSVTGFAGTGGSATGGDINISGGNGYAGEVHSAGGSVSFAGKGHGGSCMFGSVKPSRLANPGQHATGFGAGGSGPCTTGVFTFLAGGDGAPGIVIIKEYY